MRKITCILFVLTVFSLMFSCRKDDISTDSADKLTFSTDSVLFDTVFTTFGSTTKRFKIYNRNNKDIIISDIYVEKGTGSQFRINVDGTPGNSHKDVLIRAKDSLFIFLEVTIDPNNILSPFVVNDKVNFVTNGNKQSVDLAAWGQNAHYYVANKSVGGIPIVYLDRDTSAGPLDSVWTDDKPYVIYGGYLTLDANDRLTIDKGVRIHCHNGSGIWVYQGGNIIVNGTQTDPVTFQGTRLEHAWQNVPGQWDRIWINEGSADNVFNYAVIKNAFIGIQAETLPFNPSTLISGNKLRLNNCEIHNNSAAGILTKNYIITDTNSVISNSGQYNLLVQGSGEYYFNHTTFANFWPDGTRETPSIYLQNYYVDINNNTQVRDIDSCNFYNCIIDGNADVEFDFDVLNPGSVNFKFNTCILKTTNSTAGSNYQNLIVNPSTATFVDVVNHDYHLAGGSAAINAGFPSVVLLDKDGVTRNNPPDLGAYEK